MMSVSFSPLKKLPDCELLNLYYGGNKNAIAVLFSRYKIKVCQLIRSHIKCKDTTEDLYHDIVIKMMKYLNQNRYQEQGKFLSWMLRIAKNQVIDHFRKQKNRKFISSVVNDNDEETNIFDILQFDNYEDSETVEAKENKVRSKQIIKQLIQQLPDEQKEVVILRMYYDMSFKEIAEYSNVSINTSLGRMRYALINLEKMIENKELKAQLCC